MTLCRLCFMDCTLQHENLFDEDGFHSAVYHTMAKYFPELAEPPATSRTSVNNSDDDADDDFKWSRVICSGCWTHINAFHGFQQTIFAAQEHYEKLLFAQCGELLMAASSEDALTVDSSLMKIEEVTVHEDGNNNNSNSDADEMPLSVRRLQAQRPVIASPVLKKPRGRPRKTMAADEPESIELASHPQEELMQVALPIAGHPLEELAQVDLPIAGLNTSDTPSIDPVENAIVPQAPAKKPRGRPKKKQEEASTLEDSLIKMEEETSKDRTERITASASPCLLVPMRRTTKRSAAALKVQANVALPKRTRQSKKHAESEDSTENDQSHPTAETERPVKPARSLSVSQYDAFIAEHYKVDIPCVKCDFTGRNFSALTAHFRDVHNIKRGYAVCCDHKFFRRSFFVQHLQYHLNPELFKCQQCGKCCSSAVALDFHVKSRHAVVALERIFECEVCHKRFAKKAVLARHTLTHVTGSKDHVCSICDKSYASEIVLKSHIRYVHAVERRMCELCGKSCRDKYALKYHMREEHEGIRRTWPCDECSVEFRSANSLRWHKKTLHSDGSVAYKCSDCGKITNSHNALRNHKRYMHSQKRIHKCYICDKAFKVPKVLREHMTIHTGQHLYQCPYCPQTFRVSANMHHHRKRVHFLEWAANRRHTAKPPVDLKAVTETVVI